MSCPDLNYSLTPTNLGSNGISLEIVVPEVYECTNIQIRFKYDDGTEDAWLDYANLANLTTTLNLTVPTDVCSIEVRLFQCCAGDGGTGTPTSPDDPPCSSLATTTSDCSSSKITITNPYRRPSDDDPGLPPYNGIFVPKKINLTITNNDCNDIEALLCSVRCPDIPTAQNICPCLFTPFVDINSLPSVNIGRTPYGVHIDIDKLCNSTNWKGKPSFDSPNYTKVEAYFKSRFGATPFIDGVGYKTTLLNQNTYVKVHTTSDAESMRTWLTQHFRFFTLNNDDTIRFTWPYTDLYWTPYDYAIPNNLFTPETGTVYVELVPC